MMKKLFLIMLTLVSVVTTAQAIKIEESKKIIFNISMNNPD